MNIYLSIYLSIWYIYIYIYIYTRNSDKESLHKNVFDAIIASSSSSSCHAASTDIPDPLSPLLPIVHRLWQVFRATSRTSHSCWMYVRAGRPAFARPYVGVHRSTSLMSYNSRAAIKPKILKLWVIEVCRLKFLVEFTIIWHNNKYIKTEKCIYIYIYIYIYI